MKRNLKMKNKYIILVCLSMVIFTTSCDDYLSTQPDNRTQLNTVEKITQLLVSAYPEANIARIAELSSDNFIDNNAILAVNLSSLDRIDDQTFAWEPSTASMEQDSPSYIWEKCYGAIAAANHALAAIETLQAADPSLDMQHQKGEALLCRAYSHFILVNIFSQAYKDSISSLSDLGIPYSIEPEKVVKGNFSRETVTSVYASIQKDIENGIGLINDQKYNLPKYHFNTKAVAAFAARFFLFKREYAKVLYYANSILGSNPSLLMRDWNKTYTTGDEIGYDYIKTEFPCNFLIIPTSSVFDRIFSMRYTHNGDAMNSTTTGEGPTWVGSETPCYKGKLLYNGDGASFGFHFPKCNEMFEYTDKIAGIGFTHVVRAEFTAEETLLCRAEALIYLDRIPEAVADLQVWNKSHLVTNTLTENNIKSFYTTARPLYTKKLNADKLSSDFVVKPAQEPFIHCVLHFRRIETMFDGYRWFDLKRYGIEIDHQIGRNSLDILAYDDYRRAIQIPAEVIAAGMTPNPR